MYLMNRNESCSILGVYPFASAEGSLLSGTTYNEGFSDSHKSLGRCKYAKVAHRSHRIVLTIAVELQECDL